MSDKMPSYREGQAIVCDEAVEYLGNFHAKGCRPLKGECSCWTETHQKHFQAKARALRELDRRSSPRPAPRAPRRPCLQRCKHRARPPARCRG